MSVMVPRSRLRAVSRVAALATVLALAPTVLVSQASATPPPAAPTLEKRVAPGKPAHASIKAGFSQRVLHVKFVQGSDFRLRGTRLVSEDAAAQKQVAGALNRFAGVRVERLFSSGSEAALARKKQRIEAKSGREQADFNLYYRLRLPKNTDAAALIDALNALDVVEIAYAEPLAPPDPVTPDYTDDQTYGDAAEEGIDVDYTRTIPGGRGENVRIIDIERAWNVDHEDLAKARLPGALVPNGTFTMSTNNDHGTAVIGEMVADDNGFGVTGLANGAGLGMTNTSNDDDGFDLQDSIATAHGALNDGDVILLEVQIAGANGGCDSQDDQEGCAPVEYVQAYYDAIVAATSDGIIVVEAAGNGTQDLDSDPYDPTIGTRADSGAIMVGAAAYPGCGDPAHGRLGFSNYGSRVNLHAYGQCVTTTGYGGLQGSAGTNDAYTGGFSGTSSASPIVTSAAAILSSIAQQQGDADGLSSTEARTLLASGATPQAVGGSALTGNIGPMPDLGDAAAPWIPSVSVGNESTPEGTDVELSAFGFDPQDFFAVTYAWDLDNDGAYDDATGATATFTAVGQDGAFPIGVKVTDSDGASSTDTATVTVTNVAPSVLNLANNSPVAEGSVLTQSGSLSDPGWLETLSVSINWGDGSGSFADGGDQENVRPDATMPFSAGHRYGDNATYPIQVCGYDDDTSTCVDTSADATNVAPSVSIAPGQDLEIDEGDTLSTTGLFSDPGWLDTYTAAIDWGVGAGFEPVTASVTTEGSDGVADQGSASGTHTYGDNGLYTVTVRVTDDDGGVGTDSFVVDVGNIDPTTTIDLGDAVEVNGTPTVIAEAGETVTFSGDATDPGSDDLAISWDWDDGLPVPDVTTNYLVNPPGTDPPLSPTVQPRDVTDTKQHAFGDACMYLVTMATRDDDGGTSSQGVNVIITGNETRRFGAGYWYDQYRGKKGNKNSLPVARLNCYLEIADYVSDVFNEYVDASTRPKATAVLDGDGPAPPPQLHRELLTAWLNFANGAIALDDLVDTNNNGIDDTAFYDVLLEAEEIALDPTSTNAEILAMKNLLERINLNQA